MLPNRIDRFARVAQPTPRPIHLTLVPPLLHGGGPPTGPAPEAPLPDWLDLLLCIVAPCLVALLVIGGFQVASWLYAAV
ncbi:MAG: hypothetical protein Q8P18_10700 [Pseudomonadota bacterium]|nr:hypothetical protein [Pseudomonadota bacterium]